MSSTVESCRELIQQKPYDRSTAAALEGFVAQCAASNGTLYDFDILKALLKLYDVYPEEMKVDVLVQVLALAMMQMPNTDFVSLSCLVPVKQQKKEPLRSVFQAADSLERCKFGEFWESRNSESVKAAFDGVTNFDSCLRHFVFASIRSTFLNMSMEHFQRAEGFVGGGAEFTAFVASCGDAIESSDATTVRFSKSGSGGAGGLRGGMKVGERSVAQQGRGVKYEQVVKFLDAVRSQNE